MGEELVIADRDLRLALQSIRIPAFGLHGEQHLEMGAPLLVPLEVRD